MFSWLVYVILPLIATDCSTKVYNQDRPSKRTLEPSESIYCFFPPIPSHQSGIWKLTFPICYPIGYLWYPIARAFIDRIRFCAPNPRFFAVALIHVDRIDRHHPLESHEFPASPKSVPRQSQKPTEKKHKKPVVKMLPEMLPERYGFVSDNKSISVVLILPHVWSNSCLSSWSLSLSLPVPQIRTYFQACEGSHHYITYNVGKIICHPNEGRTLSSQQLLINTTSDHIPKLALLWRQTSGFGSSQLQATTKTMFNHPDVYR